MITQIPQANASPDPAPEYLACDAASVITTITPMAPTWVAGVPWVPESVSLKHKRENEILRAQNAILQAESDKTKEGWLNVLIMFRDLGCTCITHVNTAHLRCRACEAKIVLDDISHTAEKTARELLARDNDDGITVQKASLEICSDGKFGELVCKDQNQSDQT